MKTTTADWRGQLIENELQIGALIRATRRIAVLGIKTLAQAAQAAYYVPKYLVDAGFDVVPVPVYYPEATEIFGRPVYRSLASVPGSIDLVDVFRRPQDLAAHLDDIIEKRPAAVWLQSGIRDDGFARKLVDAGIAVVQNRCLMVEHRAVS